MEEGGTMLRRKVSGLLSVFVLVLLAPAGASQKPPSPSVSVPPSAGAPTAQQTPLVGDPLLLHRANLAARPLRSLATTGVPVAQSVQAFVERASISTPGEREQIRTLIAQSAKNPEVATALSAGVFAGRTRDYTQTLTALGVLGELRHPIGTAALTKFIALPLPETGRRIDGEIAERVTLEKLQMKAVDGLAYARTASSDTQVLRIAGLNPSRAVRAEAIAAYLYNHQNSAAAQKALLAVVKPNERVFIDRPSLVPGTTGKVFNARLTRFITLHPELRPPKAQLSGVNALAAARDKQKDSHLAVRRAVVGPPVLRQP
jgi:hypothetical protein